MDKDSKKYTVYVHYIPKEISGHEEAKYYVGITSQNPVENRWRNGFGYKKNIHFFRAIQKYGWENVEHQIIASNITFKEACMFEKILIEKMNLTDERYGYNKDAGGVNGTSGKYGNRGKCSEATKEKIRQYFKNNPRPPMSEERKLKQSKISKELWKNEEYRKKCGNTCLGRCGEKHPMFGIKSWDNKVSKPVICLNTMEVFGSAIDGAKYKNCNSSKLSMCCRGERKSCGTDNDGNKLVWMYFKDYLEKNNISKEEAENGFFFVGKEKKKNE